MPGGMSHGGAHDIQMMEMRVPDDIKPFASESEMASHIAAPLGEFKPTVGGMDVDPMLIGIQTKTELR